MNDTPAPDERKTLRIWQQNLRKSFPAQSSFLNSASPADWDLLVVQEPWLDSLSNTRSNSHFSVIYPPAHFSEGSPRTRSVILVNKHIPSDSYRTLPINSPDVTGIEISTNAGRVTIINVYNSIDHNGSITSLRDYLRSPEHTTGRTPSDLMYWMGDFNRHHPLWEEDRNAGLTSTREKLQPLLDLVTEHDMVMALPKDIPTLEVQNGISMNWTRPDNVWRSDSPTDHTIKCNVDASIRPALTDHLPIITVIDTDFQRSPFNPRRNFKDVDWTKFREKLREKTDQVPFLMHPLTAADLDTLLEQILQPVNEVIDEIIPMTKPSPHSKRWWTKELSAARKLKNRLSNQSYKWRGLQFHPAHTDHKKAAKRYSDLLIKTHNESWHRWLSDISTSDLWRASKLVNSPMTDGGQARIPPLKRHPGDERKAETNAEKAEALARTFFIPKPADLHIPPVLNARPELNPLTPYSQQRITNRARTLKKRKAPGPDDTPNEVWSECIEILIAPITTLFNGILNIGHYPQSWKNSQTIVLRKPGKPAYDAPKAYRPIVLLNTLAKLLSAIVAEDLSYLCEANNLLPTRAYGGRPGRITTDAIHSLTHRVKDAWRRGNVASILFLDIQSAFPNVVPERLIYEMRMIGIPETYVTLVTNLLRNRTTQLKFDDYLSPSFSIDNGNGQGCPLSVILYNIYHAPLTSIPSNKNEDAAGFIDDAALYAEGKDFTETTATLKDMMERSKGALEWSRTHNSPFEMSKLAVMHLTKSKAKAENIPDLTIHSTDRNGTRSPINVPPADTYKYLGVTIHKKLSWTPQHSAVLAKAVTSTNLFRRLIRASRGLSLKNAKLVYSAVTIPKITYACDVWYTPPHRTSTGRRLKGSVGISKKLNSIQRQAAIAISGALRTTAGDAAEIHAGLVPINIRFKRLCALSAARAATVPSTHPLHKIARKSAKRLVKRHQTAFHSLMHLAGIDPDLLETIEPTRRPPNFTPTHNTRIDPDKDTARAHDNTIHNTGIRIYSDGSGFRGGIGAAAVLFDNGRKVTTLRYKLGREDQHTVYEAEIVGVLLGLHLAKRSRAANNDRVPISISLDNTAVIKASTTQTNKPSQYLLEHLHKALENLDEDLAERIELIWIPGHTGAKGNEEADKAAKRAAQGNSSAKEAIPEILRKDLPVSLSALRQILTTSVRREWASAWATSKRYEHMRRIDKKAPSKGYEKLTAGLKRAQISILTQLRTNHIPLNFYLHRIKRAESPDCPHCPGITEDVKHFLFMCPNYEQPRANLRKQAGRKAYSVPFLTNTAKGARLLLRYVNDTKRFNITMGDLWKEEDEELWKGEDEEEEGWEDTEDEEAQDPTN
jgi:ribonuclease HI